MTREECKKRKKELKAMVKALDTLKLALVRSIAIEDANIGRLKKGENDD